MFRRREERREERPGGPAHYLMRQTLIFEDAHGREVWRVKDSMEIEGPDLEVQGNILDHEYRMEERGRTVAEVSKK